MKGAFSFRAQLLRDESVLWFGFSLPRASSWLAVLERTLIAACSDLEFFFFLIDSPYFDTRLRH